MPNPLDEAEGGLTTTTTTPPASGEVDWNAPFDEFDPGEALPLPEVDKAQLRQQYLRDLFGGQVAGYQWQDPTTGAVGSMVDQPLQGFRGRGPSGGADSIGETLDQIDTMSSAEISFLQRRLFQGGFFSSVVYENVASIGWGRMDQHTINALRAAMADAVADNASNFEMYLEHRRRRFQTDGIAADGESVAASVLEDIEAEVVDITLTDPDSVRIMAEEVAVQLLGRKPTESELQRITGSLHARQREAQRDQGPIGGQSGASMQREELGRLLGEDRNVDIPFGADGAPNLNGEQMDVARTIINVGREMGLGDEHIVGALSAAMVESGLTNTTRGLPNKQGDYSIGVFQQHGHYGTRQQRLNVAWSAQKFYEEMLRYDGNTLGEWVANTQRPAKQFRGRYDEVMGEAASIFSNLTGRAGRISQDLASPRAADRAMQQRPTGRGQISPSITSIRQAERGLAVGSPIPRAPEAENPEGNLWFDSLLTNSVSDPVYRESYAVDPRAHVEMQLRQGDPTAYETHEAAMKGLEFFAMLGAGGGHVGG